jgi:nucleotide-binding universal stress UspA family protein
MRKLLVAVDGSPASLKGARTAESLARALGAEVVFLYVVPPVVLPGDAPFAPLEEIHEAEARRGAQILSEMAAGLGIPAIVQLVKVGPPAETIAEVAELEDADMVVVGSTGKGAVKRLLVGSTADRVVHICRRPVLVVH